MNIREFAGLSLISASMALAGFIAAAQTTADTPIPRVPDPPLSADLANLPGDLRAVSVPGPSNLGDFVRDPAMARALGKALFWDMQVGSDGVQACASCHFRAGADPRSRNQLSPGLKHMPEPDLTYTTGDGPNHQLTASDFPLSRLATPGIRGGLDAASGQQRRRLVARHSSPRQRSSIRWAFRSAASIPAESSLETRRR